MSDPLYDVPSSPIQGLSPSPTSEPSELALGASSTSQPHDIDGFSARSSSTDGTFDDVVPRTRKRPAEDMSQFAESAARNVKLCPANRQAILDFAKLPDAEQIIMLNANVLKIMEKQNEVMPVEPAFKVPDSISNYIKSEARLLVVSPSLSAYIEKEEPIHLLEEKLKSKTTWNLPLLKEDLYKWDTILADCRKKMNNARHALKKAITESIPTQGDKDNSGDVSECEDILELCQKILKSVVKNGQSPSVEMLARVSFLRHCYIQFTKTKRSADDFWPYVDTELVHIREKHKNDEKKMSKMFAQILDNDQLLYGRVDIAANMAQARTTRGA